MEITIPVNCRPGALPTLKQLKLSYVRYIVQRTKGHRMAAFYLGLSQPQVGNLVKEADKEYQKWAASPSQ